MRYLVIGLLSALPLLSIAVPASSNEIVKINDVSTHNIVKITPFNLVSGSYQGLFKEQGIPSGSLFLTAIRTNKIQPEDLVRGAIVKGRLPEATLNDDSYLNHVEFVMNGLDKN